MSSGTLAAATGISAVVVGATGSAAVGEEDGGAEGETASSGAGGDTIDDEGLDDPERSHASFELDININRCLLKPNTHLANLTGTILYFTTLR